jgi:hypothetical protein
MAGPIRAHTPWRSVSGSWGDRANPVLHSQGPGAVDGPGPKGGHGREPRKDQGMGFPVGRASRQVLTVSVPRVIQGPPAGIAEGQGGALHGLVDLRHEPARRRLPCRHPPLRGIWRLLRWQGRPGGGSTSPPPGRPASPIPPSFGPRVPWPHTRLGLRSLSATYRHHCSPAITHVLGTSHPQHLPPTLPPVSRRPLACRSLI